MLKMFFRRNRIILCIFRDLFIYSLLFICLMIDMIPVAKCEVQYNLPNEKYDTIAPSIPPGELTAQNIRFRSDQKYDVYSGPGKDYLRASNGKATVSTNDWIQVFGREDGWILIQYAIDKDHMRFGWISEKALPEFAAVKKLVFSRKEPHF